MKNTKLVALGLLVVILVGMAFLLRTPLNRLRTLASLRKVDDYPLYVMRYYGDYQGPRPATAPDGGRSQPDPEPGESKWACTCFSALNSQGDLIFGRNFDWYTHPALLLFADPPDGYASVSMVDISYLGYGREEPSWSDRARLLNAPNIPFDGMNERGLAVGLMAIPHAEGGSDPQKATLGGLEVIRLLLDYAENVDQAVALLGSFNVTFEGGPPVHYLVADASGNSAVLEFLDDKLKVIRNTSPWQVSTNFVISETMPEGAQSPCWRYNQVYTRLEQAGGTLSPSEAMSLLSDVAQDNTIWSAVYNTATGEVRVAMSKKYDTVHTYKLKTNAR